MSTLALTALIVGGIYIALFLPAALIPDKCRAWITAFPRSVWPPRLLLLLEIPWAAWVLTHSPPIVNNQTLIWLVYVLSPVVYVLMITFLRELLAPRILGCALLLGASPVLNAVRWQEAPFQVVMPLLAYVWVVIGIVIVLSPYRFRQLTHFWVQSAARCRAGGLLGIGVGIVLVILAKTVYE